jgi:hypothetical protein
MKDQHSSRCTSLKDVDINLNMVFSGYFHLKEWKRPSCYDAYLLKDVHLFTPLIGMSLESARASERRKILTEKLERIGYRMTLKFRDGFVKDVIVSRIDHHSELVKSPPKKTAWQKLKSFFY